MIESMQQMFAPSEKIVQKAHLNQLSQYEEMYRRSVKGSAEERDAFWLEQATTLDWFRFPKTACKYEWNTAARIIQHTWFEDGEINLAFNCLDRHISSFRKNKVAIRWLGDSGEEKSFTFLQLHDAVGRFASVLKAHGIQKGDRVCIYLPMIPEAAIVMLACARLGAIHSVVFGGFSSEALAYRIQDSGSKLLITANEGLRGGKKIPFKEMADEALQKSPTIQSVIVVQRTEEACPMQENHFWYHREMAVASPQCPCEPLHAEDPLCILYTSGSTGKPKGVVHTQAGYLLHASLTHKYIFDIQEDDVYWCTADVGWVTGHSYVVYGPLANGTTTFMFEGVPTYPDAGRYWDIIDHYKITVFYTAPTVIRSLIAKGDAYPEGHNLNSLRILGSVGEPINPEAWLWYHEKVGKGTCPIVDTWWQTETGGILIAPLPGVHTLKPGSACRPFFGVDPIILNPDSTPCLPLEPGALCMQMPWPGMMRSIWGNHERFIDTYFSEHENVYYTGDACQIDPDGDFWLLGRMDDVINVSAHRIGTAEAESAVASHPAVAEAALVPVPDSITGQALYAFVVLVDGMQGTPELKLSLAQHIRKEIGPISVPKYVQFAPGLPKTRSGKVMRRILRKIAGKEEDLGDTTTLADPSILEILSRETLD